MEVATIGDDPGLVQRRPFRHAAIEPAEHDLRIVGEPFRYLGIEPTATVIEGCGEIPMIERDQRLYSVLEQRVDETIVEVEPGVINMSCARRQDSAPRDAEAVRLQSEASHYRDVFLPAAIVITRDVTRVSVAD